MGASLLAKTVGPAAMMLHVPTSSRAGSLPQLVILCIRQAASVSCGA
ncbi:hypothetical protein PG5_45570 [Pseudomonas sp. G5(2012)]|nr:hypothetical protein PG5_45570 [Pseudomonas sp. G5(2012)]